MLQLSLEVNVKVVTGGECCHVRGLWSEVGPCMKAAANVRSELWAMARPQLCKEKLLTGQEGLKHWGDPDGSNLLAPAWTWYRSKPVNVMPNSSSLIVDPSVDACWEMRRSRGGRRVHRNELVPKKLHWGSNLRETFATFHLWEWKHVKRGIYETFGDDHTQNTHQMLIYTHFKGNTQIGSHTHTQKHTQCCHWHFLQVKAGI